MAILTNRTDCPRSSIEQGQFSPSFIDDFICPRKGYLSRKLGLQPVSSSIHLVAGSAMHLAIGIFYSARKMEISEAISLFEPDWDYIEADSIHDVAKMLGLRAMSKYWKEAGITIRNDKKNISNLQRIFSHYCDTYKGDTATFPQEWIELPVSIPMPNGTTMIIVIDRIRQDGNHICVVDSKTSGWSLTTYYFKKYENDPQTTAYYYAVQEYLGHCDSIQIDGILIPKETHSLKDDSNIRQTFLRTPLQVQSWLDMWCWKTDFIMKGMSITDEEERIKYFYTESTRCGDYGGCQYLPVCTHGLNTPAVAAMFELEGKV